MAFINIQYCHHCEQDLQHINNKCPVCSQREYRERVAKWNALTTEEKLQDLRRRVEALEAGPPRY